jgi:hypothetical protein
MKTSLIIPSTVPARWPFQLFKRLISDGAGLSRHAPKSGGGFSTNRNLKVFWIF